MAHALLTEAMFLKIIKSLEMDSSFKCEYVKNIDTNNTELAIYALDQVHCWGTYFRPGIGHYENFTLLNFQPFLFSKQ
jgi:hypothetical protein